ncbi:hypothetical protein ACFL59_12090 [Planctomycetota bacterium]
MRRDGLHNGIAGLREARRGHGGSAQGTHPSIIGVALVVGALLMICPAQRASADFFSDPVKFSEKKPLNPFVPFAADSEYTTVNAGLKIYEMKDESKIQWAKVTKQTGPKQYVISFKKTASGTPMYVLPWKKDCGFRMTLTPHDGVDPDFFVTAPLNGCAFFVDGDPKAPTVYHFNANSVGGSLAGLSGKKLEKALNKKRNDMKSRFKKARKKYPAEGETGSLARWVHFKDYSTLLDPEQKEKWFKQLRTKLEIDENAEDVMDGDKLVARPSDPFCEAVATVFGVRDKKTKEWTFFVQPRYRVGKHALRTDGRPTDPRDWVPPRAETQWLGMSCWAFYPKGVGDTIK